MVREAHPQDELAGAGTRDGAALVVRERAAAFNAIVTKSYFPITATQLYYCITLLYEVSDGKVLYEQICRKKIEVKADQCLESGQSVVISFICQLSAIIETEKCKKITRKGA